MNPWDAFWVGIAPEHAPALIVAVLLPGLWWLYRALSGPAPQSTQPPVPLNDRYVIGLLVFTAAIHVGLPLGHRDNAWLTAGFVISGIAFAWLAVRVRHGRSWKTMTSLLAVGTLIAYLIVTTAGGEEPDQVGIVTALDELMLIGFALTPARRPDRRKRFARVMGATGTITAVLLVGTVTWIGAFAAHAATDVGTALPDGAGVTVGSAAAPPAHGHEHDHAARAQAGVVMRPLGEDHHATPSQVRAATELATATKAAVARFADLQAALDAGYEADAAMTGTDVHLENKAFADDGHVLDPQRPEALVFAIEGGRAVLLGAVFRMPDAGTPGPTPGGPITRWHSHNICFTLLPPGIGVVSPFGGCPALAVTTTIAEMMHIWTADNPGGPYVEGLDAGWIRSYLAEHGKPWHASA
ncbi:hypothetical protein F4553_007389 [Allocatelliglobosispora scoriae]|uniref:Uncharacterized protein n=1 Tax=Allocatelliglobosispora scoriae TaxID=643052 RepID=A0A841C201_9ACTN|nr:hypothetical protein [Allocatelliglobosispora scoriae]MBB5873955.1 hypothetical protein [Allocatelliglobosispora scoriae]